MGTHMRVNVAQLLKDVVGATRIIHYSGPFAIDNHQIEVVVRGVMTHIDTGIFVKAMVSTTLPLNCMRCLEVFPCPLEFQLAEEYRQTVHFDGVRLPAIPSQLDIFTIDSQHVLDLNEAVRQYALLSVPIKPLCKPDCPGIP